MTMTSYVLRRTLVIIPTLLGIVTVVFFVLHMVPGDPVNLMIPPDLPGELREEMAIQIRHHYGFDQPIYSQYITYMGKMLRFDFGRSIFMNSKILDDLASRVPNSLQLGILSFAVSVTIGVTVGIISAVARGTWLDNGTMLVALLGVSMPDFWLGLLLMIGVGLNLGVLPLSGFGGPIWTLKGLSYAILPAVTLGARRAAILARFTRSSMLEVILQDYVRTARAKGLAERVVISKHALKNALIPVVTLLGIQLGGFVAGTVVVETVFSWPGVGRYLISGINRRDFPVVQATVLVMAFAFILGNFLADLAYAYIDPRVQYD